MARCYESANQTRPKIQQIPRSVQTDDDFHSIKPRPSFAK